MRPEAHFEGHECRRSVIDCTDVSYYFGMSSKLNIARTVLAQTVAVALVLAFASAAMIVSAQPSSVSIEALRTQVANFHSKAQHQAAIDAIAFRISQVDSPESTEFADLLLMQSDAEMKGGVPKLAFATGERAWKLRERLFGATDPRTLDALNAYLEVCAVVGSVKLCEPDAANAIKQYEALGNTNAPGLAALLRTQALLLNFLSRNREAVTLIDRAIDIWQRNGSSFEENILDAFSSKAALLLNLGREREALLALDELIPRQQELLGDRAPRLLTSLHFRARMLQRLGQLDEAAKLARETLQRRSEALGSEHQDTLTTRILLGRLQLDIGFPAEAAVTLGSTAQSLERLQGASNNETISARAAEAQALRSAGLHQEYVDLMTRVSDDHIQAWGEKHGDSAVYLSALAVGLQAVGDHDGAIARIDRAIALDVAGRPASHPLALARKLSAFWIRERAGIPPPAVDVFSLVQTMSERLGPEHPQTLSGRHLQALLLGRQDGVDEAILLTQKTVAIQKRLLGESHIDTMRLQGALGQLLVKAQRVHEAQLVFDALVPRVNELRRSVAVFGAAAQRQVVTQFHPHLAERVAMLARAGKVHEAFFALDESKANTLLDQMANQNAFTHANLPTELATRLRQLAGRRASFEANVGMEARTERRETLLESLRLTHENLEAALAEGARLSPKFSQLLQVAAARPDDLNLIGKRSALVHYLKGFDDQWYAMVFSRDAEGNGTLRWFELGAQPRMTGNIEAMRVWAGAHGQRFAVDEKGQPVRIYRVDEPSGSYWLARIGATPCGQSATTATCIPANAVEVRGDLEFGLLRRHLGERLLTPLVSAIGNAQQIMISPDGALGLLPWDILLVNGDSAVRRWTFSLTPSLSVLKALTNRPSTRSRRSLLAFAASEGGVVAGETWPPLRFAEYEVNAAVALFRGTGATAFSGKQATKTNILRLAESGELGRYQRVLISAHGRFSSKRPASNAILLTPDGSTAETDGVMSVADWIGMPLNSDLIVLSACDTARGPLVAGEGLIGFGYALNIAGNRDLLATLWPVNDRHTAEFVVEFLRRVKQGLGHAAALAHTKRAFAQSMDSRRNSPRVWSAFVLYGA